MFFKNIHKRMKIVIVLMIFLFLVIIGRVFYIQVIDYKKLNRFATDLWSRNLPIGSDRGIIYDRNGQARRARGVNATYNQTPIERNVEEIEKKV